MTTPDEKQNDSAPAPVEGAAPAAPPVDPVETLQQQVAAQRDNYLRAVADLDNYRKRARREKDEIAQFSREQVIRALLPALDNLERALDHSDEGTPLHDGLLQVQKQFQRTLGEFGLVEIRVKAGDQFDPAVHEAVSHVDSSDHPEGTVMEALNSAYKLGDRLLRPARVVVSKGKPA